MDQITTLFDRLDTWRHLPNYQLERRADAFFSLYLAESLEAEFHTAFHAAIIPEFPLHINKLYPEAETDKSYKADYLAISADGQLAVLVELKTEILSKSESQEKYLAMACTRGLPELLNGLVKIFRATNSKHKYIVLLETLESLGLITLPPDLHGAVDAGETQRANALATKIGITTQAALKRVYLQPHGDESGVISFSTFVQTVDRHTDTLSRRFAVSLRKWAKVAAGGREQDAEEG